MRPAQPNPIPAGRVIAEAVSSNRYEAEVQVDRPSRLLFKETYHPNWVATVDGLEVRPEMLMPSFVGVPLSPGIMKFVWTTGRSPCGTCSWRSDWSACSSRGSRSAIASGISTSRSRTGYDRAVTRWIAGGGLGWRAGATARQGGALLPALATSAAGVAVAKAAVAEGYESNGHAETATVRPAAAEVFGASPERSGDAAAPQRSDAAAGLRAARAQLVSPAETATGVDRTGGSAAGPNGHDHEIKRSPGPSPASSGWLAQRGWGALASARQSLSAEWPYLAGVALFVLLGGLPMLQGKLMSGHDYLEYLPRNVGVLPGVDVGPARPEVGPDFSGGYGEPFLVRTLR